MAAGGAGGAIRVRRAATVICLRRRPAGPLRQVVTWEEALGGCPWPPPPEADPDQRSRVGALFGNARDQVTLETGWEVLMGQNEVVNWLRSTPEREHLMRYPGEWKFAGGTLDQGEEPAAAARRELQEEFGVRLPGPGGPGAARLRLLSVRQTRAVGGVSNIIYNFVAVAEENSWLAALDVGGCNARLAERRRRHAGLVASGAFWQLTAGEKERAAPEVREVRWLDMKTAVLAAFSSMDGRLRPVNEFQGGELARRGRGRRDSMYLTMALLLDVSSFPSLRALQRHTLQVDAEAELRRVQWLFDGQSAESAEAEMRSRAGPGPSGLFDGAEARAALVQERRRLDELDASGGARPGEARL